jgi:hypothetical protein
MELWKLNLMICEMVWLMSSQELVFMEDTPKVSWHHSSSSSQKSHFKTFNLLNIQFEAFYCIKKIITQKTNQKIKIKKLKFLPN